jgi:hypothetical protein
MITLVTFPEQHQRAMRDVADPIHRACDFFVQSSDNPSLDLAAENQRLHSPRVAAPWPDFLVAFASQGCGDYFAYDTRQSPASIIYIDPDATQRRTSRPPMLSDTLASSCGMRPSWSITHVRVAGTATFASKRPQTDTGYYGSALPAGFGSVRTMSTHDPVAEPLAAGKAGFGLAVCHGSAARPA